MMQTKAIEDIPAKQLLNDQDSEVYKLNPINIQLATENQQQIIPWMIEAIGLCIKKIDTIIYLPMYFYQVSLII